MWHLAVGYDVDAENKVGLSYLSFSGDDTAVADNSLEAWIDVAGDNHSYLGFADVFAMSNIEDITFTWDRKINDRNSFHLAYHMFSLENGDTPASILGSGLANLDGAGIPQGNGWTGTSDGAAAVAAGVHYDSDLGNELDLVWKHSLSSDVSLTLGYAMFAAGDYFTANQGANAVSPDVNYAWVTATVKF